jgi:hypothetical protein
MSITSISSVQFVPTIEKEPDVDFKIAGSGRCDPVDFTGENLGRLDPIFLIDIIKNVGTYPNKDIVFGDYKARYSTAQNHIYIEHIYKNGAEQNGTKLDRYFIPAGYSYPDGAFEVMRGSNCKLLKVKKYEYQFK